MATETVVGEDSRDKQKTVDGSSKVYSRKNSLSKPRNQESLPQQDPLQTLAAADANNSSQHHAAESDDSASLEGTPGYVKLDNIVQIRLNSLRKKEARTIKNSLVDELDQVRKSVKRLEDTEAQFSSENNHPQVSDNQIVDKAGKVAKMNSGAGSGGPVASRLFPGLSVSVVEKDLGHPADVEISEKDKRTPKANQYYKKSDFLLGEERLTFSDSKKSNVGEPLGGYGADTFSSQLLKSCSSLLSKLMKHQYGWVFNTPVDVKGLKLHDYYTIVKHPMDLGTVKTRLTKKWYKSHKDFADNVRLTFNNALLYNPKGQDAHTMAEILLNFFEEQWPAIEDQYNLNRRFDFGSDFSSPTVPKRKGPAALAPPPNSEAITLEAMVSRDPDKRDMTYEEKQKLSVDLQNLPSDKLESIIRIIRKRNSALCQQEDEIEVDIDSVDPETLWELDRFVTNYKKSLGKNKRKAELALEATEEVHPNLQETSIVPPATEEPTTTAPAVQQEGQGINMSGSSSSSSGSGSSSDSGSDSSSS